MNSCDSKPADSLVAGTFLGIDCEGNPVGAGGSIATCRDVQAAKNEAAQAASNALEKEKQERVAADNTERQERIAADSQEKQDRIAADDKERQDRIEADKNLRNETKIKTVKREGDNAIIEMLDGTQYQFSVKDNAFSGDRPVQFAPSSNGDNIEITLADGSVLDMTRQEFAEWLAGKQSPIATDEELRDGIAAAKGDLQKQLEALQKKLDAVNTDQATLEVKGANLVLTNEDGTKSTIPLSNLVKVSAAAGNAAEVRTDGIYVPTVQGGGGGGGFDKISPDANNIIVNKANGLYAPKTQINAGKGIAITGDGVTQPYVITSNVDLSDILKRLQALESGSTGGNTGGTRVDPTNQRPIIAKFRVTVDHKIEWYQTNADGDDKQRSVYTSHAVDETTGDQLRDGSPSEDYVNYAAYKNSLDLTKYLKDKGITPDKDKYRLETVGDGVLVQLSSKNPHNVYARKENPSSGLVGYIYVYAT